jgi:hypothetical protein
VPIDSPDVTLGQFGSAGYLAGLTDDGQVFGRFASNGATGLFRWKAGTFRMYPSAMFTATAFNERGDLVGSVGTKRPVVWYATDDAPTRIFAVDTAVTAVDVNERGEVLLSPTLEYRPGASIWRNGESTPVGPGTPLAASALTDSGLVWVTSRDVLVDSAWFATSAFRPGATFKPACMDHPGRAVISVDRRSPRLLSRLTYVDTVLYFMDDGASCRNLSATMPGFTPAALLERGYIRGTIDEGDLFPMEAVSNGRDAVRLSDLLFARPAEWSVDAIIAMNASGTILVRARKISGYGQGKIGVALLRP